MRPKARIFKRSLVRNDVFRLGKLLFQTKDAYFLRILGLCAK
ncbi:hypothetical protein FM102_04040 [Corynebacterium glutamicum]|nr:hypothetical protein FM102_04040 [Corynebacterium glutamicum]